MVSAWAASRGKYGNVSRGSGVQPRSFSSSGSRALDAEIGTDSPNTSTVSTGGRTYVVEQRDGQYYAREEGSNVWGEGSASAQSAQQSAARTQSDVSRATPQIGWAAQYSKDPYTRDASGKKWTEGMLSHEDPAKAYAIRLGAATGKPFDTAAPPAQARRTDFSDRALVLERAQLMSYNLPEPRPGEVTERITGYSQQVEDYNRRVALYEAMPEGYAKQGAYEKIEQERKGLLQSEKETWAVVFSAERSAKNATALAGVRTSEALGYASLEDISASKPASIEVFSKSPTTPITKETGPDFALENITSGMSYGFKKFGEAASGAAHKEPALVVGWYAFGAGVATAQAGLDLGAFNVKLLTDPIGTVKSTYEKVLSPQTTIPAMVSWGVEQTSLWGPAYVPSYLYVSSKLAGEEFGAAKRVVSGTPMWIDPRYPYRTVGPSAKSVGTSIDLELHPGEGVAVAPAVKAEILQTGGFLKGSSAYEAQQGMLWRHQFGSGGDIDIGYIGTTPAEQAAKLAGKSVDYVPGARASLTEVGGVPMQKASQWLGTKMGTIADPAKAYRFIKLGEQGSFGQTWGEFTKALEQYPSKTGPPTGTLQYGKDVIDFTEVAYGVGSKAILKAPWAAAYDTIWSEGSVILKLKPGAEMPGGWVTELSKGTKLAAPAIERAPSLSTAAAYTGKQEYLVEGASISTTSGGGGGGYLSPSDVGYSGGVKPSGGYPSSNYNIPSGMYAMKPSGYASVPSGSISPSLDMDYSFFAPSKSAAGSPSVALPSSMASIGSAVSGPSSVPSSTSPLFSMPSAPLPRSPKVIGPEVPVVVSPNFSKDLFQPKKGSRELKIFLGEGKGARLKPMANLFQVFESEARTGREFVHPRSQRAEAAFSESLATGTDFFATKGMYRGGTPAKQFKLGIRGKKKSKSKRFSLW